MDYIDIDQFLVQPEAVQKILKKYHNKYHNTPNSKGIPIMCETELRRFIEEKAGYLEMQYWDFGYDIWICYKDSGDMRIRHQVDTHDLLQAYWQVACKIAMECEDI